MNKWYVNETNRANRTPRGQLRETVPQRVSSLRDIREELPECQRSIRRTCLGRRICMCCVTGPSDSVPGNSDKRISHKIATNRRLAGNRDTRISGNPDMKRKRGHLTDIRIYLTDRWRWEAANRMRMGGGSGWDDDRTHWLDPDSYKNLQEEQDGSHMVFCDTLGTERMTMETRVDKWGCSAMQFVETWIGFNSFWKTIEVTTTWRRIKKPFCWCLRSISQDRKGAWNPSTSVDTGWIS